MRSITVSFLAPLLLCAVSQRASAAADYVAAVVNSDVITFSQVRALSASDVERLRRTEKEEDLLGAIKTVRTACLDRLIDRQVLLQELKRRMARPLPGTAFDEQINSIIRNQFPGDRPEWLGALRHRAFIRTFGTLVEDLPRDFLRVVIL
jgi:parvulin-like peptidyl-prolyl isomerase